MDQLKQMIEAMDPTKRYIDQMWLFMTAKQFTKIAQTSTLFEESQGNHRRSQARRSHGVMA
jgi:hypothetical protein